MTDAKCNFWIFGSFILSAITLDSPAIFMATITDSPTVTKAVKTAKSGEVQFRAEKAGVVHAGIGKASFDAEKIAENATAFIEAIKKSTSIWCKRNVY